MIEHLLEEVGLNRVQDVEEIVPWRALACGKDVWKVLSDVGVIAELWPQRLDGDLVIVRDLDARHGLLLHQLLLAHEDLLQEVFVHMRCWRQVVLYFERVSKR